MNGATQFFFSFASFIDNIFVLRKISKLEINHHNYKSTINCTVDYRSIVVTNKHKSGHSSSSSSSSSSPSSKSINKRKVYKGTHIESRHLLITPASKMLLTYSKRSREIYSSLSMYNPKRRRLDAGNFTIEPIIDEYSLISQKCFEEMDVPDQNENLLSPSHRIPSNVAPIIPADYKSKPMTVSTRHSNNNINEMKLKESSPVDTKFDLNLSATKSEDFDSSIDRALTKIEKFQSATKLENDSLTDQLDISGANASVDIKSEYSFDPPSVTYPGQILWTRFGKYKYWPSIVCQSDEEVNKGEGKQRNYLNLFWYSNHFFASSLLLSVFIKFFADKGRVGWVNKRNIFEFQGIESFLEYKKIMKSVRETAVVHSTSFD